MTNPIGRKACPEVAKDMAAILKPAYRFGPAPKYTKVQRATGCGRRARALTLTRALTLSKVDHATGWLKSIAKDVWPPPVPSSALTNSRRPHP